MLFFVYKYQQQFNKLLITILLKREQKMKNKTKCVNCGAGLVFIPGKNMIGCEHCGSYYALPAAKNVKLIRKYSADFTPERDPLMNNQYSCNSCGSLHVVQSDKTSKRCPSCGSTNIKQSSATTAHPDGIMPFELTKEQALKNFEKWLKKRPFTPNDLLKLVRNRKISSVYVPVYNFGYTNACRYSAIVKKVHEDKQADEFYSTTHSVSDIKTYQVQNQDICANNVVDKDLVEQVSVLDVKNIVPFSGEYLFGYSAIDTNISVHDAVNRITKECEDLNESKIRRNLKQKYDEIESLNCSTRLSNIVFNYAYVPVFMNHFTYKGKNYHCYIGGRSGKVAGKTPKSAVKILITVLSVMLGIAGLVWLIMKYI